MLDQLFTELMKVLTPILVSLLVAAAGYAIRRLHLSVSAEQDAQLAYYANLAVLYAEEKAANYLKTHGVKMDPISKLNMAVTQLLTKVPRIDQDEAVKIVQASLPGLKMGAAAGAVALGNALRTPEAK